MMIILWRALLNQETNFDGISFFTNYDHHIFPSKHIISHKNELFFQCM